MTIKTIIVEPNKILRQVSKPVNVVNKTEQQLMDDMLETMYAAKGIGLAAIQIGVPKRIIVMDLARDENKKEPMYFVNPVIKNKNMDNNILIFYLILHVFVELLLEKSMLLVTQHSSRLIG